MKTNLSGQKLWLSVILMLMLISVRGQKQQSQQLLSNSSSKGTAPVLQEKNADVIYKKTAFQESAMVNDVGCGSISVEKPSEIKQRDTQKTKSLSKNILAALYNNNQNTAVVDSRPPVTLVVPKQFNEECNPKEEKITKMELITTEAN